jgi:hypothetical protein
MRRFLCSRVTCFQRAPLSTFALFVLWSTSEIWADLQNQCAGSKYHGFSKLPKVPESSAANFNAGLKGKGHRPGECLSDHPSLESEEESDDELLSARRGPTFSKKYTGRHRSSISLRGDVGRCSEELGSNDDAGVDSDELIDLVEGELYSQNREHFISKCTPMPRLAKGTKGGDMTLEELLEMKSNQKHANAKQDAHQTKQPPVHPSVREQEQEARHASARRNAGNRNASRQPPGEKPLAPDKVRVKKPDNVAKSPGMRTDR